MVTLTVGYKGGSEKRSGSRCALQAATLSGLAGGLDVGCERERRFGLNWLGRKS